MAEDSSVQRKRLRDDLYLRQEKDAIEQEIGLERRRQLRMRQFAVLSNFALVMTATIAAVFYFREFMGDEFGVRVSDLLVPVTIVVSVFGFLAFRYLEPSATDSPQSIRDTELHRLRYEFERRFAALQREASAPRSTTELSDADKKALRDQLAARFESDSLADYLNALKESVNRQIKAQSLEDRYQLTRSRLVQETKDLAKRGNFNLIIGAFVALSGLAVLGYTVANTPNASDPTTLIAYYIPRTALVVLIEVFAYFFLSLYRTSLIEIKYFQNELTNVESKHLAWELSLKSDDPQVKVKVIEQLAATERNAEFRGIATTSPANTTGPSLKEVWDVYRQMKGEVPKDSKGG